MGWCFSIDWKAFRILLRFNKKLNQPTNLNPLGFPMNPIRKWAIASYEFLFAEPGIEVEYWDDEPLQLPYSDFPTAGYFLLDDEEMEDQEEDNLEDEGYGLVHYRIQALGGDTFIEYSYEGELDEAAIVQALTHLWQTTPHPNNQLVGTLQLPIAPAYLF